MLYSTLFATVVFVFGSFNNNVAFAFQPTASVQPRRRGQEPSIIRYSTLLLVSSIKDDTGSLLRSDTSLKPNYNHISIEYCTGCRWMLKSFWYAQELLSTFGKNELDSVTVIPSFDTQGRFLIQLSRQIMIRCDDHSDPQKDLLWDRKEEDGFPSVKELKQTIRDIVNPNMFLGHSDTEGRQTQQKEEIGTNANSNSSVKGEDVVVQIPLDSTLTPSPSATIIYCTGCQWMLRAAYLGQELLTTFSNGELKSVTLVPSKPPEPGGRFVSVPKWKGMTSATCLCDRYLTISLYFDSLFPVGVVGWRSIIRS